MALSLQNLLEKKVTLGGVAGNVEGVRDNGEHHDLFGDWFGGPAEKAFCKKGSEGGQYVCFVKV